MWLLLTLPHEAPSCLGAWSLTGAEARVTGVLVKGGGEAHQRDMSVSVAWSMEPLFSLHSAWLRQRQRHSITPN
ncbi:unnamed protein product [Arctogadus glacialis]